MFKIDSLLNPASEQDRFGTKTPSTPPATPSDLTQGFSATSISQPATPITPIASSTKRPKRTKDTAGPNSGPIRGSIHYPPHECNEKSVCLSYGLQLELEEQHRFFKVEPSNRIKADNLISNNVQHIPYSSEKRGFQDKTGRGGFDVFNYSFYIPGVDGREGRKYTVMWDYQIGLVRITPFFKACNYSKTVPNKALAANAGLKDLSYSITGGAVAAQGYWVPYGCARAICLTFCHSIRWVLTPIFGPSFIKDCLAPDHPNFGRYKIDPQLVRNAALEQESWKHGVASRSVTPARHQGEREIPRSAPGTVHDIAPQGAQSSGPRFKPGSPFAASSEASTDRSYVYSSPLTDSPALSPKSKHRSVLSSSRPGWTSINRSGYNSPLPTQPNTPLQPLSGSLLAEPRYSPHVSWRAAELTSAPVRRVSTRRSVAAAAIDAEGDRIPDTLFTASSDGESSDSQPAHKRRKTSKSATTKKSTSSRKTARGSDSSETATTGTSGLTRWTEEDMWAAKWLLNFSNDPRDYRAPAPGQKRKASG